MYEHRRWGVPETGGDRRNGEAGSFEAGEQSERTVIRYYRPICILIILDIKSVGQVIVVRISSYDWSLTT